MAHHIGDATTSLHWTQHCNDLIQRVCALYPENFVGVCQLPQTPSDPLANCIAELERCIGDLGFIGCNLNPDPSGGYWTAPPLTDKYWYPFYEKMVELDVPAMVHVSASCNPSFHATGAHYINADTTAFMQFLTADLFKDLPGLRFIIPHGGGAVPYHWGRYRGLAQDMKRPPLDELIRGHVFFDTCVYHMAGIELLLEDYSGGQYPVRLGNGRRRAGHRSRDGPVFRRHEAIHRCEHARRRRQAEDFRRERAEGVSADQRPHQSSSGVGSRDRD